MSHPDHSDQLTRLARVRGQIDGIGRMIEERRYCVDILTQLRAAHAALRAVEEGVLKTHVRHCVKDALSSGQPAAAEEKLDELFEVMTRFRR